MTENAELNNAPKQKYSTDAPVVALVESVDFIFSKLGIPDASFRNPSKQTQASEKIAGLTNTYLQPTRIGRRVMFGDTSFFYGQKFNITPVSFEAVPYDAPSNVRSFVQNRLDETLTDYISIHQDKLRLNLDIRNAVVKKMFKLGFDGHFTFLANNKTLTIGDLVKIIQTTRKLT